MSVGPPRFSDLVDPDVPCEERERLSRVHELLVAAGPPTPVPHPAPRGRALSRRRGALALVAAAVAAAAVGGYLLGREAEPRFETRQVVEMRGTDEAPGASAVLRIGARDENGNWPMRLEVEGLRPLPDGYYSLLLTRNGRPVASCGTFQVGSDGIATVGLSASYRLNRFDGWVVMPYVHGREAFNRRILLTT